MGQAVRRQSSSTDKLFASLTHPGKVLYPVQGITKIDLARYYASVAPLILPHIAERPLTVVRCPEGNDKACFFQRHVGVTTPKAIEYVFTNERSGNKKTICIGDIAGLVALVQIGVLEIHTWGATRQTLEKPDRLVFDLDPGPGVEWRAIVEGALRIRDFLQNQNIRSFVKTSGGKGLHVVAPIEPLLTWAQLKNYSQAVAKKLADEMPETFTVNARKVKRSGKIFLDYMRNARGATWVAPFSTRALKGCPVSVPVHWDELKQLSSAQHFNLETTLLRLMRLKVDPWDGFFALKQSIRPLKVI